MVGHLLSQLSSGDENESSSLLTSGIAELDGLREKEGRKLKVSFVELDSFSLSFPPLRLFLLSLMGPDHSLP